MADDNRMKKIATTIAGAVAGAGIVSPGLAVIESHTNVLGLTLGVATATAVIAGGATYCLQERTQTENQASNAKAGNTDGNNEGPVITLENLNTPQDTGVSTGRSNDEASNAESESTYRTALQNYENE
ncbi:hypothetical protein RCL_jg27877.t1 [Rhizophagus clarus]|nr:hypothetical protein RCL_jg27877.t1 [Rhizophagus clarus]